MSPLKIFYYTASGLELANLAEAYREALEEVSFELKVCTASDVSGPQAEERLVSMAKGAQALVFLPHGGERSLPGFKKILEGTKARLIHVQPVGGSDEDLALVKRYAQPQDESFARRVKYLHYGGPENLKYFLLSLVETCQKSPLSLPPPRPLPTEGLYHPEGGSFSSLSAYLSWYQREKGEVYERPRVGLWFYQGYWVNRDLKPIDALVLALERQGVVPIPVFHRRFVEKGEAALKPLEVARTFFKKEGQSFIHALINLQPFSHRLLWPETAVVYPELDVAVLQGLMSFVSRKTWEETKAGLSPLELAISIAQPEFDGALITLLVATREEGPFDPLLGLPIRRYEPLEERVETLGQLALNWAKLRLTPPKRRKIAIIFHHYPPRADRMGCAFGLDSFASIVELLKEMKRQGYFLEELYASHEELAQKLASVQISDLRYLSKEEIKRRAAVAIPVERILSWVSAWPAETQEALYKAWGKPPGKLFVCDGQMYFGGLFNGNIFISLQPPRGKHEKLKETGAIVHDPDLPPPYHYLAFYRWLKDEFGAHAVVHVGKHGTLEWLPGKAVALSRACYPDLAISTLPNIYPYIVNDPGEGTQAKRRSYCAIIDHMIPPQMAAGRYGVLEELSRLLEEYRLLKDENPVQARAMVEKIIAKACEAGLNEDLSLSQKEIENDQALFLERLHDYLDQIAAAYVNDGLHVLGKPPTGKRREETVAAIAKGAGADPCEVAPLLEGIREEITLCLKALSGGFVPPGPSGAPTRGDLEVLPTGRNFFSVDPQKIPTKLAWERGVRQAKALLERYLKDQGRLPRTLAMVIWGSPTMRTRGEDFACALYLLGVRPLWHPGNQRVLGVEPIPLQELGRPRIDVTLRTSGFFRDAFRNLMELFDEAVRMVALLAERDDENYLAAHYRRDLSAYVQRGKAPKEAERLARIRVFSDPPGAYGAGLGEVLDTGVWSKQTDLAEVYLRWGGYAYGKDVYGEKAGETFKRVLSRVEVTYKNDDTREVDLLSCDCPNAYHGGLNVAVLVFSGKKPVSYSGSSQDPEKPIIRTTEEEMRFLFRTKVLNPKWIEGMKRHGYKGAGDLSRTIDYCFHWDATSDVLSDWMYEEIARTYVLSREMQTFFLKHNPQALLNITERLLEAAKRGLWGRPAPETLKALENIFLEIEALVE